MLASFKPYIAGMLTYTPLAKRFSMTPGGGTDDPRYCYGVFMRHLIHAHRAGLSFPRVVAELGPGDSIGTGLAWLIAGAERYHAFDVCRYATGERTPGIFDALVELFRSRAAVPGADEFPELKPSLDDLDFPRSVLPDAQLAEALDPVRLTAMRSAVCDPDSAPLGQVEYIAPWDYAANLRPGSVDLIFSQAVMEHVEDVDRVYAVSREWLTNSGMVSHQIDFRSHGTSQTWDGYRAYSEFEWLIVRGRRDYLINRLPDSGHVASLHQHGFRIVTQVAQILEPTLKPHQYAARFRDLGIESRRISGVFLQAVPETSHGKARADSSIDGPREARSAAPLPSKLPKP
jgi:hypothetical protein